MKYYNLQICTADEAARFVQSCEADFRSRLDAAVEAVLAAEPSVIALSGPTCSGKTTTANRLIEQIGASGHHAVVLSIDDFFLDRRKGERNRIDREVPDYDSVAAIDLEYFSVFLNRLRNRQCALVPKYDFTATRRIGYHEYCPDPMDIYVIEGIQAVYPEVTALFGEYCGMFISVMDDVTVNGVSFGRHEVRLLRRIVRDYNFRGATPEFSFHLWQGVRKNEEENIFPNVGCCGTEQDLFRPQDLFQTLDSFQPYELCVIRNHVLPLLDSVPETSIYRRDAEKLAEKLIALPDIPFDDCMIPQNSVFREFIG